MQPATFAAPFIFVILLLLAGVLGGLFMLVRGMRGRQVDDHPICRKCGFDLFGRPEGVERCSECGADLNKPHAIQMGHREKRRPLVFVGSFVACFSFFIGVILGLNVLRDVSWIQIEPTWYVFRESQISTIPADRTAALQELARRVGAGELSDEQVTRIADAELAWQADLKTPWVVERGDLIDAIHTVGKLPKEKWASYLVNAAEFRLMARKQVRRGDVVPTGIEEFADRCGSRTTLYLISEIKLGESDLIIPKKWEYQYQSRNASGVSRGGRGSTGHNLEPDPKLLAAAADGTKTARMSVKFDVYDHSVNSDTKEAPLASKTVNLSTTWDLVPADAATVTKIEDPSLTAAVEKSITVKRIDAYKGQDYVNLGIDFRNVPVALACKIILRSGDREWPAGAIYVGKGGNSSWGTGDTVKKFDATSVDVIFRPDEKTALDTIGMTEYWTGEVTIKNVPVKRSAQ